MANKKQKVTAFSYEKPVRGEEGHCVKYLTHKADRDETKALRAKLDAEGIPYKKVNAQSTRVLMVRYVGTEQGVNALYAAAHELRTRVRKMTPTVIYLNAVYHDEIAKRASLPAQPAE